MQDTIKEKQKIKITLGKEKSKNIQLNKINQRRNQDKTLENYSKILLIKKLIYYLVWVFKKIKKIKIKI